MFPEGAQVGKPLDPVVLSSHGVCMDVKVREVNSRTFDFDVGEVKRSHHKYYLVFKLIQVSLLTKKEGRVTYYL